MKKSELKEEKSINGAGLNSTNPIQLHLIDFFSSPAALSFFSNENVSLKRRRARPPTIKFIHFSSRFSGRKKSWIEFVGLAASRSSLVPRLLVDGIDPLHLFVSFVIPQTKFSSSQPTTNGALSSIVDEFIGVVAGSVLSFFAERCGWLPPLTHSKREEPTTPFIHQHSASAPAFNSFISFSINQLHEDWLMKRKK